MGRKFYLSLIVFVLTVVAVHAQTGEIKGKITETGGKEGVPFAGVSALVNNVEIISTSTDIDGNFTLKPLSPGKYDVKVSSVGFNPVLKTGVVVSVDATAFANMEMAKGIELKEVVIPYQKPLIDIGNPATTQTITRDEIIAAPTRDVNSIVSQGTGVYQKDEGGAINIRGSRSDATTYIVDGMKVIGGTPGIPNNGTEQITAITGGIPAQYGDVTGGVISITTRGPADAFGGGIELGTSEGLDAFGYNLAALNLTGPIYSRKDAAGKKTGQSIAGFFLAAEYQYDKDPKPSNIPIYKVNDDLLNDVRQHPLVASPEGGYVHRSTYFTNSDFVTQKYRENVAADAIRVNGKLDVRPVKNVVLTFGGSFERVHDHEFVDIYSLMNYDNNPEKTSTNWRAFARLTQRFTSTEGEKSSSVIKNAYYNIQIDYSHNREVNQNDVHKDNIFDYGYVGKFKSYTAPVFDNGVLGLDTPTGTFFVTAHQTGNGSTFYEYTPGTQNPNTSNYTTQYYQLTDPLGIPGFQDNASNVQGNGGLLNKDNRLGLNVYGLWATPGRVQSLYSFTENTQGRLTASGSADIKNHNIVLGFEYEQRVDRGFTVNPNDLWTQMNLLGNQNLKGFDSNSVYQVDTMVGGLEVHAFGYTKGKYTQAIDKDGDPTVGFYENIRNQLGIAMNDTIQTDLYAPSTYSLGLFTPDELLNNGNSLINYYGYDYTGTDQTDGNWDLKDFYVNKDANNNFLRKVDAFRPTYFAGYIQDRFRFNDIVFNIGLRVDRFDANQKVLKDPYSLYEIHKASEVNEINGHSYTAPSNIGQDYAVYVNDIENPTEVVGFRNGSVWYDASGTVTTDLTTLTQGNGNTGGIKPYLTKPDDVRNSRVNPNAFADYEPQVTYMPRIAFSFPISDEAYFSAHYDVLTQRPQNSDLIRFNPISYLEWSQGISRTMSNPNLKPERTTEYEFNFQQTLSRSSAFSIAAFYKELRDNIQFISLDFAYPIKYNTYGNIDFGTVKGLTFSYDLRRSNNVKMTLSYTLSFADGTGSDANANSGILAQQGQTNLREIKPLSFDQRHTFVASFDYHYGKGKAYDGPVWFKRQIFSDAGANIVFRAGSGSPYTRQSNITPTADFTTTANSRPVIQGSINGSRYPWNFKIDAKFDKSFDIRSGGKDKDGNSRRGISGNIYLQVLNILNTQNILTVYAATGSPNDDGYIDYPGAQSAINSTLNPQSYIDMYRIAVNDPDNYSLPRRIRLGVQINF